MPLTIDQAKAEAAQRWCKGRNGNWPCAWHHNGKRVIGFTDHEFRYAMGRGETWEEAFADADRRLFAII